MSALPPAAVKAFHQHRRNAKRRAIPFLFTAEKWWAWWTVDGRWERRGRGRDLLVMARKDDAGPYSPENVYCATHRQNLLDAGPKRIAVLTAIHASMTQAERTARFGVHLQVRGDGHPCSKAVLTPLGRFGSAALAADTFRINPATATQRARGHLQGWRYETAKTR